MGSECPNFKNKYLKQRERERNKAQCKKYSMGSVPAFFMKRAPF